jgi:hypothetical protein
LRDRHREVGLVVGASRAHGVLLRVTPTIPRSLDSGIDQFEPVTLTGVVGRRWKRE